MAVCHSIHKLTLVLNLLTPRHVIQVSDRRLVWLRNGSAERHDDEKNKAVLWCGRLTFAYTGLAELGQERRTDLWLATRLSKIQGRADSDPAPDVKDQGYLLRSLAQDSTEYFAGPRISQFPPTLRRHAFVAVGWATFQGESDFSPYLALVSNFHDSAWKELAEPTDEFHLRLRRLQHDQAGFVLPIGHAISQNEINTLADDLSLADDDPLALVAALGEKIRAVASTTNTVGRGLMANVLPRDSVSAGQTEHMALLGRPTDGHPTFLYVPANDDPQGVFYGPVFVCGGSVVSGFTVTEARSR